MSCEKTAVFRRFFEQIRRHCKHVVSEKTRRQHRRKRSCFIVQVRKMST